MGVRHFTTERKAEQFVKKSKKNFPNSKLSVQGNSVVFRKRKK